MSMTVGKKKSSTTGAALLLFDNYDMLRGLGMWHERLMLQMLGISQYAITFVTFSVT